MSCAPPRRLVACLFAALVGCVSLARVEAEMPLKEVVSGLSARRATLMRSTAIRFRTFTFTVRADRYDALRLIFRDGPSTDAVLGWLADPKNEVVLHDQMHCEYYAKDDRWRIVRTRSPQFIKQVRDRASRDPRFSRIVPERIRVEPREDVAFDGDFVTHVSDFDRRVEKLALRSVFEHVDLRNLDLTLIDLTPALATKPETTVGAAPEGLVRLVTGSEQTGKKYSIQEYSLVRGFAPTQAYYIDESGTRKMEYLFRTSPNSAFGFDTVGASLSCTIQNNATARDAACSLNVVDSWSAQVNDEDLKARPPSGTYFETDKRFAAPQTSRHTANRGEPLKSAQAARKATLVRWIIAANAVGLAILGLALYLRHRRRRNVPE